MKSNSQGKPRRKPHSLPFLRRDLLALADKYSKEQDHDLREEERHILEVIAPATRRRGHFEPEDFIRVCQWKSLRPRKRYEAIASELIREATRLALGAQDETLRIGILLTLDGISWPTASVLLHFGHKDPYPILDYRALESLGVPRPSSYTFEFWWRYVESCRKLAKKHRVDMRTLDRALWRWSADQA